MWKEGRVNLQQCFRFHKIQKSIIVWDCECDQCAWVNSLINLCLCSFFSQNIKLRGLLEIPLLEAWGSTSSSLRLSSDLGASTKYKAIFTVASFQLICSVFTPAWRSNFSKFLNCPIIVLRYSETVLRGCLTFLVFHR